MTVISTMKFNQNVGAIVGDEQSSTHIRKYDHAEKLHDIINSDNIKVSIGGTGASDILYKIAEKATKEVEKAKGKLQTDEQVLFLISQIMSHERKSLIDGVLIEQLGVSQRDIYNGYRLEGPENNKVQLEMPLMREYEQIKNSDSLKKILNNAFLSLSYQTENGISINSLGMGQHGPWPSASPYITIGSGQDMADTELSNYVASIPRSKRKNINPIEGIAALLYATEKASITNIGVGGTPMIKIVSDKGIISPDENSSRLAVEIVKGSRAGYLPKEFEHKALESLIFRYKKGKSNFEKIEKAMWDNTSNQKELSFMLRGYNI